MPDWLPTDVDPNTPNAARVYDVYLGGTHNLPVDREFARRAKEILPDVDTVARMNRSYLQRVVGELTRTGIDQFLDLGSGIPTNGNVHEIAQSINPRATIVYVDNEKVAVAHSAGLLAGNDKATILNADIRQPHTVLEAAELLDFTRPVGVIMCTILHFISDADDPLRIVRTYRDALVPGSYLAISHGTTDNRPDLAAFGDAYRNTPNPVTLRPRAEVERFFDGFDLIEPGLVFTPQWRPLTPSEVTEPERAGVYAGVGRKR
jgi:hypothetical protein